ncbi:MAG: hypothetical protein AAGF83_14330 [Cyanobacteria bacterium P01_G01_bin.67]
MAAIQLINLKLARRVYSADLLRLNAQAQSLPWRRLMLPNLVQAARKQFNIKRDYIGLNHQGTSGRFALRSIQ